MFDSIMARTRVLSTGSVNRSIEIRRGQSKYPIRDISGLGPVGSEVVRLADVSDRGSNPLSARTGERNIVMRLGFEPDYAANETITQLRLALNRVFMPGNTVELDFDHDIYGVVRIVGTVESNEPVIFSKDPEVQISILCNDPYFIDPLAMYEYLVPEGTGNTFTITSDLDVPVGFIFDFDVVSAVSGAMLNAESTWAGNATLFITRSLLVGDRVLFSTIKGERRVELVRNLATSNALPYFNGSLVDTRIYPGLNHMRFNEIGRMDNVRFRWWKTYGSL